MKRFENSFKKSLLSRHVCEGRAVRAQLWSNRVAILLLNCYIDCIEIVHENHSLEGYKITVTSCSYQHMTSRSSFLQHLNCVTSITNVSRLCIHQSRASNFALNYGKMASSSANHIRVILPSILLGEISTFTVFYTILIFEEISTLCGHPI